MDVGRKVLVPPIAPIAANTEVFDAGAVSFGVEYRRLDDDIVGKHLSEQDARRLADIERKGGADDRGVSIHVYGRDGHEYLRFDCFDNGPHYHYITPGQDHQVVVTFDAAANGDPLDWTLTALRGRLVPMLREAGGGAYADACDPGLVNDVLARVEHAARAAAG
ncbi:DUF7700 domain-containing protein [Phenylobacterium sp.]|jgi:hypothetical protein|uniref:DUF7700 domain-containing protein n=1 Tax=Phenylobacterium sp. TaxID=1871053 RepID=UPI002F40EC54